LVVNKSEWQSKSAMLARTQSFPGWSMSVQDNGTSELTPVCNSVYLNFSVKLDRLDYGVFRLVGICTMPALTLLCFLHVCGNIISPSVVLLLWLRLLLSNLDYCRLTLSGNNLNAECKASTIRVASMQIVSMLSSLHTTPFTLYLGLSNLWEMIRFMMYVLIADLKAHVNLCNIEVDFLLVFSLYD
jgi:hypothetical protein